VAVWLALGGAARLGAPLTEPFVDGGVIVQYLERAELRLVHGKVQLAALGRRRQRPALRRAVV